MKKSQSDNSFQNTFSIVSEDGKKGKQEKMFCRTLICKGFVNILQNYFCGVKLFYIRDN